MTRKKQKIIQSTMESVKQDPSHPDESVSEALNKNDKMLEISQAAPLLLDEWKYHNAMFSEAIYRYGLAEVFIAIAPYLLPGFIKNLGWHVLFFPGLAILIAVYATYHLESLSLYVWQSDKNYRKVMGGYAPTMKFVTGGTPPKKFFERLLINFMKQMEDILSLESVTSALAGIFFPLSLIIQIANILILINLINTP